MGRIFSGNYSYRKGAWVVHMLRGVVGDEAFFEILDAYRERFAYSAATSEDFREVAEGVWGGDLSWFFDEWVYGGGAPAYEYGHQEHEIAGQRFLEISLEQTQVEGVFAMPLEIEIGEGGQQRRTVVWNSASTQHYLLPVSAPVDALALDPDAWILTRSVEEAAFTDGPPKIVTVDPAPGSVLQVGEPLTMTVIFHEDVVIDAADISLRRIGGGDSDVDVSYDADTHHGDRHDATNPSRAGATNSTRQRHHRRCQRPRPRRRADGAAEDHRPAERRRVSRWRCCRGVWGGGNARTGEANAGRTIKFLSCPAKLSALHFVLWEGETRNSLARDRDPRSGEARVPGEPDGARSESVLPSVAFRHAKLSTESNMLRQAVVLGDVCGLDAPVQ